MTEACMYKSLNMYISKKYSLLKADDLQMLHKMKHAMDFIFIICYHYGLCIQLNVCNQLTLRNQAKFL